MKLTVQKSRLEACVKNLRKVINKKNVLPIMADIMFDVDEEKKTATLSASDTEIWLTYTIQLEDAQGHGKFCVTAQQLQAMMSELKEQPLTLIATTESTNIFTMVYENGSAHCAIDNADEYPMPTPMKVATDVCYNFDAGIMNDAIKRSLFAMSTDETRIVLNGVYLNFHNRQLDTALCSEGCQSIHQRLLKHGGSGIQSEWCTRNQWRGCRHLIRCKCYYRH